MITLRFLLMRKAPGERFTALSPGFHGALSLPLRRNELENAVHAVRSLRSLPGECRLFGRVLSPAGSRLRANQLHVLVAEDNETNRQVLRAILERAGHRLTVVENGDAALDLLQQGVDDFDLMVLDKNMPGRSGLDVFRALRFMYPRACIPTIILSADATSRPWMSAAMRGSTPISPSRSRVGGCWRQSPDLDAALRSRTRPPGRPPSANNPASLDASLIDYEKVESLRRLGEGGAFFEDLVAGFQRDAERSVAEISKALASSDYPALRGAVHALEGSASEVGAAGLAAAAGRFRFSNRSNSTPLARRNCSWWCSEVLLTTLERIKASESGERGDQVQ